MSTSLEVVVAKIETRLDSHLSACERRYQEGNDRIERLFSFMKEAHAENRKDIGEIKNTLAEQRGAGRMAKLVAGAVAGLMGLVGGVGGSHFIK